jgi:cell division protein FtsL
MAAYIHGNLAINESHNQRARDQVVKRKLVKKSTIPSSEKLLYLFSILIFVVVSGILVSRVAESYEYNYKIQEIQSQMETVSEEITTLQLQVSELQAPERIVEKAMTELGMVPSESQVLISEIPDTAETVSR